MFFILKRKCHVCYYYFFFRKVVYFPNWLCAEWLPTRCPSLTLKTVACWTSAALTRKQSMSSVTSHLMSFKIFWFCSMQTVFWATTRHWCTPRQHAKEKDNFWNQSLESSPSVIQYPAGWINWRENQKQINEVMIFIQYNCFLNLVQCNVCFFPRRA